MTVTIIDYGAGNLANITRAIRHLGAETHVTSSPRDLDAELIVFPGVGAAGAAMHYLHEHGLDTALRALLRDGTPFLGVCLGMQILFEASQEGRGGHTPCLGVLPGQVYRLPTRPPAVKVPHIGWNQLQATKADDPLLEGIGAQDYVYFVHAYAASGVSAPVTVATSQHGRAFPAVVHSGNVFGTQFHPEKSSSPGLRLLSNLLSLVGVTR